MFSFNKTVVCLEFSKTSVFCALAQISGRKVDIIAVDSIEIENGILEEGVIYDSPHLEQIVKNLVTSVSKTYSKVDAAWIAIPDNKVLITKFDVFKDKKGIREEDLHKAIEEKFNYSASKLLLINRQTSELNSRAFFLCDAIRKEHLDPFMRLFDSLSIPVEGVFPTFQCIYEDLKSQINVPTLVLYPGENGYKFFLADIEGVHLWSVWGHNLIELNENFDKAIDEIVRYAGQSKEVALGVKNILVVESSKVDSEKVQEYLQRTRINFNWVPSKAYEENGLNAVNILMLKGLLKAAMAQDLNKGFLEPQLINENNDFKQFAPSSFRPISLSAEANPSGPSAFSGFSTPMTKNTMVKDSHELENNWNPKVIIVTVILGALILGLLAYAGVKISKKISEDKSNVSVSQPTNTPTVSLTPTPSILATATPTPTSNVATPTPTPPLLTKSDVKVQVLNANNTAGEASKISGILNKNGYTTKKPGNSTVRNLQSTTVSYKDERAAELAKDIAKLIEPSYSSAQAVHDPSISDDILVVLGAM